MDEQMTLFDVAPSQMESFSNGELKIVKAEFMEAISQGWYDLFSGYDEMYGITFSSGIKFMDKVFDEFKHIEMIFGCEGVLGYELPAIISMQAKMVEEIVKSKSAKKIAERMKDGSVDLFVSRDTKSHEKIFILKAEDGRTRVITGSANMSASAFLGIQREEIICFDDIHAFEYYKNLFDEFKETCSDSVSEKVIGSIREDEDYLRDNITEVPIIQTIKEKKMVVLEPSEPDEDTEIIADVRGLEAEIKPLLPRVKPENGKVFITGDVTKSFKRKYEENANVKRVKEKKLPKLHIDYDNKKIDFNGKEYNLLPNEAAIKKDIDCLYSFIDSLSSFHGDYLKSQKDYYRFLNWYFCSPFLPYLRYVGYKNEYGVTPLPVVGILYGDSNGGKSTFVNLLSKLMCGKKIPANSSSDFTGTNISNLKASCEGLPINIDDLAKTQYDAHFEKVIKDDNWGILERFLNYPSLVITTNKLASLKPDISKRVVTCRIDSRIDKESGARNSKKINESLKQASNALFSEYSRRMFTVIEEMSSAMREGNEDYFPDIFDLSSKVLLDIFDEYSDEKPEYIQQLSYSDYFGDLAIGKHAINQIKTAWRTEPKMFEVKKKENKLIYTYPENGRLYELKYLQEELPPALEAQVTARSLVMNLDVAIDVFGESFKRSIFG